MEQLSEQKPRRRYLKKKRIQAARNPDRRRGLSDALLAGILIVLTMLIVMFLVMPLVTREKVITVNMGGAVSVKDQPSRFERVVR